MYSVLKSWGLKNWMCSADSKQTLDGDTTSGHFRPHNAQHLNCII